MAPPNQSQSILAKKIRMLEANAKAERSGVKESRPRGDPPQVTLRPWMQTVLELPAASYSPQAIAGFLLVQLGFSVDGEPLPGQPTANTADADLLIRRVNCWGSLTDSESECSLRLRDMRQSTSGSADRFVYDKKDLANRNNRSRLGAEPKWPVLSSTNAVQCITATGEVVHIHLSWRIKANISP